MPSISGARAIQQLKALKTLGKGMRLAAEGWKTPFQTLIAVVMSARTKDETTIVVAEKLFKKYPDARSLARANVSSIEKVIRPVNFFRNKSKSIVACANELLNEYRGVPPHDVKKLINLSGVGRKTANVFLAEYGASAIGVDTHVGYISRALGWSVSSKPEQVERDLMRLFPRRLWRNVNMICVHFGKTYLSRSKKDELLAHIRSL